VAPLTGALKLIRSQQDGARAIAVPSTELGEVPYVREGPGTPLLASMMRGASYSVALATAYQVPAFVKALKTYTHTISTFPLRETVGMDEVVPRPFLGQPNRNTTYWALMTRTVSDLLLHDRCYWVVTSRTWDGFPRDVLGMPLDQVTDNGIASTTYNGLPPRSNDIYWNGVRVPGADVIRFDGDGIGGWLTVGASVINTAAALEAATLNYAAYPLPSIILKNTGADIPAEVVDELLTAWEDARSNRSTAYLNSTIETKEVGWNASEMQLTEAKNYAGIQVARLANLDPVWVGAGVESASLTYANRVDLYRQLLDLALRPVMAAIEQRLSGDDVTPRGHEVEFDTTKFLRQNPTEVGALITSLFALVDEMGNRVLTVDEARALLDLPTQSLGAL